MSQHDQRPSLAGGIALLVLGLVILVPSGLCTGVFALGPLIGSILHPGRYAGSLVMLPTALMFGGPFILIGGAMAIAGFNRIRKNRKRIRERDLDSFN